MKTPLLNVKLSLNSGVLFLFTFVYRLKCVVVSHVSHNVLPAPTTTALPVNEAENDMKTPPTKLKCLIDTRCNGVKENIYTYIFLPYTYPCPLEDENR